MASSPPSKTTSIVEDQEDKHVNKNIVESAYICTFGFVFICKQMYEYLVILIYITIL